MNNDSPIRWNLDKKKEREQEQEKMKAKRRIGALYENWKKELCMKPRTRREILRAFYNIRDRVLDESENLKLHGLEDFGKMTYNILERHITELFTLDITGKNIVKQHIPASMQMAGQVMLAKVAEIRTSQELLALDFVRYFAEQPGFTTFFWQRIDKTLTIEFVLLAHFFTGDTWMVAKMVNDIGLDDIPEYSPESSEPTEPGTTDAPDTDSGEASSPADGPPKSRLG